MSARVSERTFGAYILLFSPKGVNMQYMLQNLNIVKYWNRRDDYTLFLQPEPSANKPKMSDRRDTVLAIGHNVPLDFP